jgi:hypothetical protein
VQDYLELATILWWVERRVGRVLGCARKITSSLLPIMYCDEGGGEKSGKGCDEGGSESLSFRWGGGVSLSWQVKLRP